MSRTVPLSAGLPADPSSPSSSRSLSSRDVKTLGLSALGGTLEFYDFVIYVFFAAVLGKQFFPVDMPDWLRQLQTFGIFAAGYLSRPLGGIIIAHFGDLLGRKRMFTLSIFMMAVPTLVIATARDFIHPIAHAQRLAALIPGARLSIITSKAEARASYVAEFRAALAAFFQEIST